MSPLLDLPRELRDEIIDYVVSARRCEPPWEDSSGKDSNGSQRVQFEDTHWKDYGNVIYFEGSEPAFRPTYYGLLLACQQLRAETRQRARVIRVPHILDLLLIDDRKIWATWLSMPERTPRFIRELRVNMRFQCNVCAPTTTFLNLYGTHIRNLIYRIFAVGCAGRLPHDECQKLFLGARYKFQNTIRFEKEYVPRHCIRKLTFAFQPLEENAKPPERKPNFSTIPAAVRNGQWVDQQPYVYAGEWATIVEDTIYSGITVNHKHPGWLIFPENLGGIQIFCKGGLVAERADLGKLYTDALVANRDSRMRFQEILAAREENGML